MHRGRAALLLCVIALAGCGGGGHESAKAPRAPALTVPETTPAPTTGSGTQTAPPAVTTTTPGGGGAAAPTKQPDSPQNDQPAPGGSPASKYERFCRENPGACGN